MGRAWRRSDGNTFTPGSRERQTRFGDGRHGRGWALDSALPPRKKVAPVTVTIAGKNSITLTNVLVGEVWVCSGQSNMEWPVSAAQNHQSEISDANFPLIRIFKVERNTARSPDTDVEGSWTTCSPDTVGDTSAVAYFFGRELHQKLKRPIGLIQAAFGGANCEALDQSYGTEVR